MPKYITRVKLLDANEKDYEELDIEFSKKFFTKKLANGSNNTARPIRLNEYYTEGNITLPHVTAAVYNAAKKIGKKFTFTVMRDKGYYPLPGKLA